METGLSEIHFTIFWLSKNRLLILHLAVGEIFTVLSAPGNGCAWKEIVKQKTEQCHRVLLPCSVITL